MERTEKISGALHLCDDRFGLSVYSITGAFDGASLQISGTDKAAGAQTGTFWAKATLTPEGQLRGQWSTTLGSAGTFILWPHDTAAQNVVPPGLPPERLHTATRTVGALRLYLEDVKELLGFLSADFTLGRLIVTYRERGSEISRYASDLQNDLAGLGELKYLKLLIQEPDAYGIYKVVTVELNSMGVNEVRVQGVQESWVVGKAETIATFLKRRQKALATSARSFGLNINTLLVLGALVLLPELPLGRRIIFLVVIAVVILAVAQAHARLIPNVLIYLSPKQPGPIQREWPQALSWIIAATSALAAAIAYGTLRGEIPLVPSWF
jgi:hypothetical protein